MGQGLAESNAVVGTNRPKAPPPRDRVLDDVELACIWRAAGDDDFGRIVKLLVLTGARRTEVGGMAWSEIKTERGTWTIPGRRTKNHREHVLPLSGLALSIIGSVPERVGRDCLFGERASRGFTAWAPAKAALDTRLRDQVGAWRIHDLRRSFATRMCDLGVAPHVVEQILNHQSGHRGGVVATYNKSKYEGQVKSAIGMWADHVRALAEGGERVVVNFPQAGPPAAV
jgi:integrase